MNQMTVAVAQMLCCADVQENYEKAERMIAEAAQKGAKLIVFPECMNYVGPADPATEEDVPNGEGCRRIPAVPAVLPAYIPFLRVVAPEPSTLCKT